MVLEEHSSIINLWASSVIDRIIFGVVITLVACSCFKLSKKIFYNKIDILLYGILYLLFYFQLVPLVLGVIGILSKNNFIIGREQQKKNKLLQYTVTVNKHLRYFRPAIKQRYETIIKNTIKHYGPKIKEKLKSKMNRNN